MKKFELENGVRVLVDSDRRFACAAVVLCCEGGIQDERLDEVGISHLVEHLLFKRTKRRDTRAIAGWMDELGGEVNAFTDMSSLCLSGLVPGSRIDELLDLFRELLCENAVQIEDVEIEREIIRQEILEAMDDPADLVFQRMNSTLWPQTILRYPVFGTLESVEQLTLEAVQTRLQELLAGKRLIVAVSGNVDEDAFVGAVRARFGTMPSGNFRPLSLPKPSGGLVLVTHPVHQVHFALSTEFPSLLEEDNASAAVFASALGDGMSSRLFQLLREEQGIAYDVGASVEYLLNRGVLTISGTVERESAQMALEFIVAELSNLRQEAMPKAEIDRVVRYLRVQLEFERDSLQSRLWRMIDTESVLGRYVSTEEAAERIDRVDPQTVREFIDKWISPRGMAVVLGGNVQDLDLGEDIQRLFGDVSVAGSDLPG